MDLLRDVLFNWQDRHFDWLDIGEYQKVKSANGFRFHPSASDVDHDLLEPPAAELCTNAVSHRHTFKRFTRRADLLDVKGKEIIEVDSLSGDEVGGGRRLVVAANEIHVFRGPRAFS